MPVTEDEVREVMDRKKSYTCEYCGVMLSPADDPHYCPVCEEPLRDWKDTGTTIAEEQAKVQSLGDYRDDIIEAAINEVMEVRRSDRDMTVEEMALGDAVDAYHAALRATAREGK